MNIQTISTADALGMLLADHVLQASGTRLMSKGHTLSDVDIVLLAGNGIDCVTVAHLDTDEEMSEYEGALAVVERAAIGAITFECLSGGAAGATAQQDCCVILDSQLLWTVNRIQGGVQMAARPNLSFVPRGGRVLTAKSPPFSVSRRSVVNQTDLLDCGPLLQARPADGLVAVIYTHTSDPALTRSLYDGMMNQRLAHCGVHRNSICRSEVIEQESFLASEIESWVAREPDLAAILIASPSAPATPDDVVGRAIARAGGMLESFMAPVDPGSLLQLSYLRSPRANGGAGGEIPIISAPGCWRQAKPNVVDLLLPALLSRYRLSAMEIAMLGNGGLLG